MESEVGRLISSTGSTLLIELHASIFLLISCPFPLTASWIHWSLCITNHQLHQISFYARSTNKCSFTTWKDPFNCTNNKLQCFIWIWRAVHTNRRVIDTVLEKLKAAFDYKTIKALKIITIYSSTIYSIIWKWKDYCRTAHLPRHGRE